MSKIIDCVTFFNENFIFDLRYKILEKFVDQFVVCESRYDHKGKKKKLNFEIQKYEKKKINYIVLEKEFPVTNNAWQNQAFQRDYMLKALNYLDENDYIFFSDPDEIIKPKFLQDFNLKKKYGIFLQKCFNFKFNLFNPHETPWEGTRVCKKKNLKSIDWLRQKVLSKNIKYGFWRFDKEKNIQIINDGGWHFNYLLKVEEIAKKFKSLAETSWDKEEFFNENNIREKINQKKDLFNRGHIFERVEIDKSYPKYLQENKKRYHEWIIE